MADEWTVHKFGGSVLRGAPDLDRLTDRVSESDGRNALVVSALWGTTDRLLRAVDDPAYADRLVADLRAHHLMFAPRLSSGRDGTRFERVLASMGIALEARRADPSTLPHPIAGHRRTLVRPRRGAPSPSMWP